MAHADTNTAGKATNTGTGTARFTDEWWRQYDTPTGGYTDSTGFTARLPLRLESTEWCVALLQSI